MSIAKAPIAVRRPNTIAFRAKVDGIEQILSFVKADRAPPERSGHGPEEQTLRERIPNSQSVRWPTDCAAATASSVQMWPPSRKRNMVILFARARCSNSINPVPNGSARKGLFPYIQIFKVRFLTV